MSGKGLGEAIRFRGVPTGTAAVTLCALLLGPSAIVSAASAEDAPDTRASHIRPADRCATRLLADAVEQSAIVRGLIEQLTGSDVIVYLTSSQPLNRVKGMPRGKTHFLTANPAGRFLQVWVDPAQGPAARMAVLAHELQHALEVAGEPAVTDLPSFRAFYEGVATVGHATGASRGVRRYETAAAVAVETRVLRELGERTGPGTPGGER